MTKITKITKDIDTAVSEIKSGNTVALPTETVYGLGADALNENAVVKIFEAKERPRFNPLIVHVYDTDWFERYGTGIPEDVYRLAEKFSPGPITFIVKKKNIIPDIATAGNDTVGLRIPSHNMFREVIRLSGVPVCAPSANRSGMISPTSAEEVIKELNGKISFILDGGRCEVGIESTVIAFTEDEIKILRHGFITKEDIESVTGKKTSDYSGRIISPGLMKSHYAPETPLYLTENLDKLIKYIPDKTGILDFSGYGSPKEIAVNLYSELRKLDEYGYEKIIGEKIPDEGLGTAINDRLERASRGKAKLTDGKIILSDKENE